MQKLHIKMQILHLELNLVEKCGIIKENENMVKIINVADEIQADYLCELLKKSGIIAVKKAVGAGGYLSITSGRSIAGYDILVSEQQAENGIQIVERILYNEQNSIQEDEDFQSQKEYRKKHGWKIIAIRIWAVLMFTCFFLMMVLKIFDFS